MSTGPEDNKLIRKPFRVGDWLVDPATGEISRENELVRLEPKSVEVLVYLAERAGTLITRQELEDRVWANTVVSYDSLTSCINKIRKAFQDSRSNPAYIETISKKGYRLIAPVEYPGATESTKAPGPAKVAASPWTRARVAALAGISLLVLAVALWVFKDAGDHTRTKESAPVAVRIPTVAVLPFKYLGDDPKRAYLSDGLTDDLITQLSKHSGLFVIAAASTFTYRDSSQSLRDIGRELSVRYIVTGSFRKVGNKIRVSSRLIEPDTGHSLWAESYDRSMDHLFSVQDEVVRNIVSNLSVHISKDEERRVARRYTRSIDAYEKFLQGQREYVRLTRKSLGNARELFHQAITIDPTFARAYAALALTYADEYRLQTGSDRERSKQLALEYGNKAVELDDTLPQAHWVLGFVKLFVMRRPDQAIVHGQRALELDPNHADAMALLAVSYVYTGEPTKARKQIWKAMQLNPHYPARYPSVLGYAYYFEHNYAEAVNSLQSAIDQNYTRITPHVYITAAYARLDRMEDAKWAAGDIRDLKPDFDVATWSASQPFKDRTNVQDVANMLRRSGL
jgi:TolB-like protein/DNA-binding winged helix-turn-helix (wHTH) protein